MQISRELPTSRKERFRTDDHGIGSLAEFLIAAHGELSSRFRLDGLRPVIRNIIDQGGFSHAAGQMTGIVRIQPKNWISKSKSRRRLTDIPPRKPFIDFPSERKTIRKNFPRLGDSNFRKTVEDARA